MMTISLRWNSSQIVPAFAVRTGGISRFQAAETRLKKNQKNQMLNHYQQVTASGSFSCRTPTSHVSGNADLKPKLQESFSEF